MTLIENGQKDLPIARQTSSLHRLQALPWVGHKAGSEVKCAVVIEFHSLRQTGQFSVVNEESIGGRESVLRKTARRSFGNDLGISNSLRFLGCRARNALTHVGVCESITGNDRLGSEHLGCRT